MLALNIFNCLWYIVNDFHNLALLYVVIFPNFLIFATDEIKIHFLINKICFAHIKILLKIMNAIRTT